MTPNYILMYGTPYLTYRPFERFEDMSKFMVKKQIYDYKIFAHLEDIKEIEMIYRDSDIHFLEKLVKETNKEKDILQERIGKALNYIDKCKDYHKNYHKEEKIFPDEITSLKMILKGEYDEISNK